MDESQRERGSKGKLREQWSQGHHGPCSGAKVTNGTKWGARCYWSSGNSLQLMEDCRTEGWFASLKICQTPRGSKFGAIAWWPKDLNWSKELLIAGGLRVILSCLLGASYMPHLSPSNDFQVFSNFHYPPKRLVSGALTYFILHWWISKK